MKPTLKLMAVFVLLLVTFPPQSAVSAEIYKNEGRTAWASFYHTDDSGCITLHVNIEIWEDGINSIAVTKQDTCNNQYFEAYGHKLLSKREVKFIGNMDSVKLRTTVPVTDFLQGLSFDVFVDLTWTGTGEIIIYEGHYNDVSPDCHKNAKWISQYRTAQASGTVSDGVTNFTPEPSQGAELYAWKQRTVTQGCE